VKQKGGASRFGNIGLPLGWGLFLKGLEVGRLSVDLMIFRKNNVSPGRIRPAPGDKLEDLCLVNIE